MLRVSHATLSLNNTLQHKPRPCTYDRAEQNPRCYPETSGRTMVLCAYGTKYFKDHEKYDMAADHRGHPILSPTATLVSLLANQICC